MKAATHAIVVAVVFCALSGMQTAEAQVIYRYIAELSGNNVVPATPSPGQGTMDSYFDSGGPCAEYYNESLNVYFVYSNLEGTPTGCYIHRGASGSNGDRLYTVFPEWFPPGAITKITINLKDCPDFENFMTYVIIETDRYPTGEIRGQIYPSATPVEPSTWGMIKATYE